MARRGFVVVYVDDPKLDGVAVRSRLSVLAKHICAQASDPILHASESQVSYPDRSRNELSN